MAFQALQQATPTNEGAKEPAVSDRLGSTRDEDFIALEKRVIRCMAWALLQLGHAEQAEKRLSLSVGATADVFDHCLALEICCSLPARHLDIAQRKLSSSAGPHSIVAGCSGAREALSRSQLTLASLSHFFRCQRPLCTRRPAAVCLDASVGHASPSRGIIKQRRQRRHSNEGQMGFCSSYC
jgi:hypothetical protein